MSQVFDGWKEIKELVEGLEFDATKNGLRGNAAAGVRLRKGLRTVKARVSELVKLTVTLDKQAKQAKTDA